VPVDLSSQAQRTASVSSSPCISSFKGINIAQLSMGIQKYLVLSPRANLVLTNIEKSCTRFLNLCWGAASDRSRSFRLERWGRPEKEHGGDRSPPCRLG
jgi:hypothetical protein